MWFLAHSGLRYLVLALGLSSAIGSTVALVRGRPAGRVARILRMAFVGLLDLQVLLGVIVLLTRPFLPAVLGHLALMVGAAAVAHGASIAIKRRPEPDRSTGLALVAVALPLALIVAGILALGRPIVGR